MTERITDSVKLFESNLYKFMAHTARIIHQFKAIAALKKNITDTDMILHIDFAENYSCKYGRESQSVHFGASREQLTLHTGVLYTKNFKKSFCTVSESLKHDSAAIIAHLMPILSKYLRKYPKVCNLHIISDSPSTQYRNKNSFFLLSTYLPQKFSQIRTITHSFTESGHGKSAADGVGSTVKRTADDAVAHGNDVSNINAFMTILKQDIKNIDLDIVTTEDINTVSKITCDHLQPFKGTMSVHQ